MTDSNNIEKLKRFSEGLTSPNEDEFIYSLFAENEDNPEFENQFRQEFEEYIKNHPEENHDLSYLLDRIHHIMHKRELQKKETVVKRIYRWYSVAAAVLLIPLIVTGAIWLTRHNQGGEIVTEAPVKSTIYAPMGSRINFSLPDGTEVWLNSGSSLEYQLPFSNNREITLSGEAWFDVARDAEHPFEVASGDSKVKVLGTKFNLNTYPDEKYLEVVLEEGKVEFSTVGLPEGVQMKSNERLVLEKDAININETDASKYTAWKEGKLSFRGDTMDEVARRIGRWYNVSVEVVDEELKSYTFRGIFQDDTLEDVVHYISMTSPMRYRIIDRIQLEDGTIQKKKVLLYKKNI